MKPLPNIPGLTPRAAGELANYCAQNRIRTLRIFGSCIRGELTPQCDIDVLIEFQTGVDPDLFELGGMQQDLTDILGRETDLKTPEMFSPANLQRILASSVIGYAA